MSELDFRHALEINYFKNKSTLSNFQGIPLVNRFILLLNAPVGAEFAKQNEWLELQVLSVDCPEIGLDIANFELNGMQRFYAKGRTDGDLQVTFLETPDLTMRRFFQAWIDMIFHITSDGTTKRSYSEEYEAKDFKLLPLDFEGKARYGDRFIGAFPYKIADINYNFGTAGEMIKSVVYFKYRYHDVCGLNEADHEHLLAKIKDTKTNWSGNR